MKRLIFWLILFLSLSSLVARAQEFIPLYVVGKMPNSKGLMLKDDICNERVYQVGTPGMYVFLPSQQENKDAAILICPGSGYQHLAYAISGTQLCEMWLVETGIIPQVKK